MGMKLGLINSAWAQAGRDTAFGIRMTREIGFDCIDLFADPLEIDARERRLLRTECAKNNLPVISLACVAVAPVVGMMHKYKYLASCAHA